MALRTGARPLSGTSTRKHAAARTQFPIVGIGASAGGVEAALKFFRACPAQPGLALVLVQHLDPTHDSSLKELIARVTPMPVSQVTNGLAVQANHVYVIPPNVGMVLVNGSLRLLPRTETRGIHMPIDQFFRSLAEDRGRRAVGVILSGTGSDGALGLADIKERGGITFVQDARTAKFAGMPQSALAAGEVDFVLPVEGIAHELVRIARHPYVTTPGALREDAAAHEEPSPMPGAPEHLAMILRMLRSSHGVDFTGYKPATILRRISRRMTLHKLEQLEAYVRYLREYPAEQGALYHDLLIKVTSFFRDPGTFDALTAHVFPAIMRSRPPRKPIRIWVPGCSGGEEAYSILICLLEFLGDQAAEYPIQCFATDLDEKSLTHARMSRYLENIAADVSQERLWRFFTQSEHHFRVNKVLREMCTFARHNVFKDPPFSNLDLISCRNLLIYLEPALQRRVIPMFHYALNPNGFLSLGPSENIGPFANLFAVVDKKFRVYAKKPGGSRAALDFLPAFLPRAAADAPLPPRPGEASRREVDVQKDADRVLLGRYAPNGVLVNEELEIMQVRGDVSRYLMLTPGKPSHNLLKMVREGLLADLQAALLQAKKTRRPVRREGVRIRAEGRSVTTAIQVMPLPQSPQQSPHYVVVFEDAGPPSRRQRDRAPGMRGRPAAPEAQLRQELSATKEYLQSTIEQQDATNEELKSANEEILSSNEELQSTNEELETSKEELQSTNEELVTVNEEVRQQNLELSQANNDLNNLFSSSDLPIIMLGPDLRIRRFTPVSQKKLGLEPTDIGQPISHHLKLLGEFPALEPLLLEAMNSVSSREEEVLGRDGRWYLMRVRPYLTEDKKVEGAVLLFIDINSLKDVDRLTALLQDKDVLLKEVHHRVKNNLQVVCSLLSMQAEEIQDAKSLEKFKDSQDRIRSMALIHEKLYQAKDLAHVDFSAYARSLVDSFYEANKPPGGAITVAVEVEQVYLSIDAAIPCGLILNELLSNAFKYAFPGGRRGEIIVRMTADAQHRYELSVRDTGIGLPAGFDLEHTESLGLRIVKALTGQLRGALHCDRKHGTTLTVTFGELPRPSRRAGGIVA